MKIKEIRDLSYEELTQKLADLKAELFTLRFQNSTSQLDNTSKIAEVKKSIAKVMTVMREIEIKEGK
ncbi:MAG: 50S ribosomal protein L29 [Clostridia bacterium]|nr:50S ribosomal protein L29 [Clostridia bacterium]